MILICAEKSSNMIAPTYLSRLILLGVLAVKAIATTKKIYYVQSQYLRIRVCPSQRFELNRCSLARLPILPQGLVSTD